VSPESEPDLSVILWSVLIRGYWINRPAKSLRDNLSMEQVFLFNGFDEPDEELKIVHKNHSGLGVSLGIDIHLDNRARTIYIARE